MTTRHTRRFVAGTTAALLAFGAGAAGARGKSIRISLDRAGLESAGLDGGSLGGSSDSGTTGSGTTGSGTTDPGTTGSGTTGSGTTTDGGALPAALGYDPLADPGSMRVITKGIGAEDLWAKGVTGAGADIAVIDTGVAPVPGLAGKLVNGLDVSFDRPYSPARGVDANGHGTHMASIAAGYDADRDLNDPAAFVGVAPGSRILNVKVGAYDGGVDVTQVLAAIDWVVQNRNHGGLNVKVINLAYGTNSRSLTGTDPLVWATENAWKHGIVVVAAAGNGGERARLSSPARNPSIIAVGASVDNRKTEVAEYTSGSEDLRQPDVYAPGSSVIGLRVPGSFVEQRFGGAAVGSRFLRGTGTSQATAVMAGSAALLASAFPSATPDEIKAALINGGTKLSVTSGKALSLEGAYRWLKKNEGKPVVLPRLSPLASGIGLLERARGDVHVVAGGEELTGERDIFGADWKRISWSMASASGSAWSGTSWNGSEWDGSAWSGNAWNGQPWTGAAWTGAAWTGAAWTGVAWTGVAWTGVAWTGVAWTGVAWTDMAWMSSAWRSSAWKGAVWS